MLRVDKTYRDEVCPAAPVAACLLCMATILSPSSCSPLAGIRLGLEGPAGPGNELTSIIELSICEIYYVFMSNAPSPLLRCIILDIDAVVSVHSCYNDTKETTDTGKTVKGEYR